MSLLYFLNHNTNTKKTDGITPRQYVFQFFYFTIFPTKLIKPHSPNYQALMIHTMLYNLPWPHPDVLNPNYPLPNFFLHHQIHNNWSLWLFKPPPLSPQLITSRLNSYHSKLSNCLNLSSWSHPNKNKLINPWLFTPQMITTQLVTSIPMAPLWFIPLWLHPGWPKT